MVDKKSLFQKDKVIYKQLKASGHPQTMFWHLKNNKCLITRKIKKKLIDKTMIQLKKMDNIVLKKFPRENELHHIKVFYEIFLFEQIESLLDLPACMAMHCYFNGC